MYLCLFWKTKEKDSEFVRLYSLANLISVINKIVNLNFFHKLHFYLNAVRK